MTHYVGNHDLQHVDRTPSRPKKDATKTTEAKDGVKLSSYQAEKHEEQKADKH